MYMALKHVQSLFDHNPLAKALPQTSFLYFYLQSGCAFSELEIKKNKIKKPNQSVNFTSKLVFYFHSFCKQDIRAIQNTSKVVNDTVLKYKKSFIICISWGEGSAPPDPVFLPMKSLTNS